MSTEPRLHRSGGRSCEPDYGCIATAPRTLAEDAAHTGAHVAGAIVIQLLLAALTGDWWAGAAAGAALFVGREFTQAEYRWIERFGGGRRANMPWWGGIDRRLWDRHSLAGWIVPLTAVATIAALQS
jgi:hypothetical protein